MADPIDYIRLQEAGTAVNLAIAAFLIVTLTLRFLVRRGSVKLHYFFLLASSVFALIEFAVTEGAHNIIDSSGLILAITILDGLSTACIVLTAVLALRQFTVSYLKGPSSIVDSMLGIAALACLAGVVIAGFYGRSLTYEYVTSQVGLLWTIRMWIFFALWVWLVLVLLVIRIANYNKIPLHDDNRSTTIKTFGLIALYIVMNFVFFLYVVIEAYLPTPDNGDDTKLYALLVANEVLNAILFRLSALLFVFFYDELSVMEPVPSKRDTYEEHEF